MSESALQSDIRKALQTLGYSCRATSAPFRQKRGRNWQQDKGMPDLFVTHKSWGEGVWKGLEVKTGKGTLKPEQQELLEAGRIIVVRSVDEAIAAVIRAL